MMMPLAGARAFSGPMGVLYASLVPAYFSGMETVRSRMSILSAISGGYFCSAEMAKSIAAFSLAGSSLAWAGVRVAQLSPPLEESGGGK